MKKSKEFLLYKSNRDKTTEYFKQNGIAIKNLILSNHAHKVLERERIYHFYQLIKCYPNRINEFWGVGEKTILEICDMVESVVDRHLKEIENLKITKTIAGIDKTELYDNFKKLDVPIEELNLSQRTYNSLKRENVNYLHDALAFYPDGFADFWSMGTRSINEINNIILGKVQEYVKSKEYTEEPVMLNQSIDVYNVLNNELEQSKLIEYVKAKNIKVEDMNLSVRSSNALRRENIHFFYEVISYYPDGFDEIRNIGTKSVNELKNVIENFVLNQYSEIKTEFYEGIKTFEQETDPFRLSINQLLKHPIFKSTAEDYFQKNQIFIEEMMLSNRSVSALKNAGYNTFFDVLQIYPSGILKLKNIGAKSIEDINKRMEEYISKLQNYVSAYCSGNQDAMYPDEFVYETVLSCFKNIKFTGLSYKNVLESFPDGFNEERIKKCIGQMLADKILEYVDFRLYKAYPSIIAVVKEAEIDTDDKNILLDKFNGMTLEEIGKQRGITRERVRQKSSKLMEKVKNIALNKYGSEIFDEDYYAYLYSNYEVIKELWFDFLGVSESTFGYLVNSQTKGSKSLSNALSDTNIDLILKYKIQNYLNKNKLLIDGILIEKQRADIENYALAKLCREEITYNDFAEQYNELLVNNGIEFDDKVYYTDDVRRTRTNRLSESMLCLWKQGEKIRYYDIASRDYEELLDALNLESYVNTEVSTLKFFNEFPEIMTKYDIRDQYELHNLLKKVVDCSKYNDISFSRQPMIKFGEFDRDKAIYSILEIVAPVSTDDLTEYIYMEYGYDKKTAYNYLKPFNQYYHKGTYTIDFKKIPTERVEILKKALVNDFYYISEIKKIYKEMFYNANIDEINPLSLKELGFLVLEKYAIQNYETAEAYFTHILTKDGICDVSEYNNKYANLRTYSSVYRELRLNYDILLFERDKIITISRLNKLGITKTDIKVFCDAVENYIPNNCYFNMHSLRKGGFTSKLEELGFDDYFYEMILAADQRYLWQRAFGRIVLYKGKEKSIISVKSFVLAQLSNYEHVYIDEFIDECFDEFGIRIPNKYEITEAISNTSFYYDSIMDKIYRNKNIYYEEFDD